MTNKKVSIITLCYNHLDSATKPFIESLYKYTDKNMFELIIVDNNSTDGTKEYLEKISKEKDNIKVIFNSENTGYSAGNNQGLKIAQGEYLFLINNDALFTPNWLDKFISVLSGNDSIGLVAPLTNSTTVKAQRIKQFKKLTVENYLDEHKKLISSSSKVKFCSNVIFFCVGMKKSTLEQVGYLDENFGLAWYEDDDYCMRLNRCGLKIAVLQNNFIFHNHSQSSKSLGLSLFGQELALKNENYFFEKHKRKLISQDIKNIRKKLTRITIILCIQLFLSFLIIIFSLLTIR